MGNLEVKAIKQSSIIFLISKFSDFFSYYVFQLSKKKLGFFFVFLSEEGEKKKGEWTKILRIGSRAGEEVVRTSFSLTPTSQRKGEIKNTK